MRPQPGESSACKAPGRGFSRRFGEQLVNCLIIASAMSIVVLGFRLADPRIPLTALLYLIASFFVAAPLAAATTAALLGRMERWRARLDARAPASRSRS